VRKLTKMILGVSMMALPVAALAKDKEPKPVEMSQDELAKIQKREIAAETDVVFRSSISALQEMGYVNINASRMREPLPRGPTRNQSWFTTSSGASVKRS